MLTKEIALAVLEARRLLRQADKAYSDAIVAQNNATKGLEDALKVLRAEIKNDNLTEDVAYNITTGPAAGSLAVVRVEFGNVIKVDVRT